jgi:hypothetical protein
MNNDNIRVYIAGPLESVGGNMNAPLFAYAASRLRDKGFEVFSPIEYAIKMLGPLEDIKRMPKAELAARRRDLFAHELHWICTKANLMVMLPGWMQSAGARIEHDTAAYLGIRIWEMPNVVLLDEFPDFAANNQLALR